MKKIIQIDKVFVLVGFYNQVIIYSGMFYIFGQIVFDFVMGELVIGDIEVEICWVMENFWVILVEVDLIFEDVIKCSIFVLDMNNYG